MIAHIQQAAVSLEQVTETLDALSQRISETAAGSQQMYGSAEEQLSIANQVERSAEKLSDSTRLLEQLLARFNI
jgi:methyl-accepting chemotaxis protein